MRQNARAMLPAKVVCALPIRTNSRCNRASGNIAWRRRMASRSVYIRIAKPAWRRQHVSMPRALPRRMLLQVRRRIRTRRSADYNRSTRLPVQLVVALGPTRDHRWVICHGRRFASVMVRPGLIWSSTPDHPSADAGSGPAMTAATAIRLVPSDRRYDPAPDCNSGTTRPKPRAGKSPA